MPTLKPLLHVAIPLVALCCSSSTISHAWETHTSLMPSILASGAAGASGATGNASLPDAIAGKLDEQIQAPCPSDDQRIFARLASELKLNPKANVEPTAAEACARQVPTSGRQILLAFVDEPDHGMDQDLPWPTPEIDPNDVAKWMGGTKGPTSTGYRHMYFGGWQLWHPLKTFQIPTGGIGYARERAALMVAKSRELLAKGGVEKAWGYRVLAWALHYYQDLSQPFHAVQIPALGMVPWYALLKWPLSEGFADLVHETTRTISNYHFSYEHYTYYRLTARIGGPGAAQEVRSPYADCLERPDASPVASGFAGGETRAMLLEDPRRDELARDPALLADRVAHASVQIGGEVGSAAIRFFGVRLKSREVDVPAGKGELDYNQLTLSPELVESRAELLRVTCRALGNASVASRAAIQAALAP